MDDMDNSNNSSIVLKLVGLDQNGFSYLITGDTETERWDSINRYFGKYLASDVMAASHHVRQRPQSENAPLGYSDTVLISAGVDIPTVTPMELLYRPINRLPSTYFARLQKVGDAYYAPDQHRLSYPPGAALGPGGEGALTFNDTRQHRCKGDRSLRRQARLYPALLRLLPLLALVALLYWPNVLALRGAVTLAVSCGGLFLMTNICREAGKRLEDKLYQEWGGKPTTQLLRHRDTIIDSVTKRRYHAFLAAKICATFPDAKQEKSDPAKADEVYESGRGGF